MLFQTILSNKFKKMIKPSGYKNIETTKFKIVANSLIALLKYWMIYSVTNNCRNRLLLNKQRTCLEDDEREYKLKNKVQLTKKNC